MNMLPTAENVCYSRQKDKKHCAKEFSQADAHQLHVDIELTELEGQCDGPVFFIQASMRK